MVDEDGRERMVGAQSHSQNLNHGRDVAFLFFLRVPLHRQCIRHGLFAAKDVGGPNAFRRRRRPRPPESSKVFKDVGKQSPSGPFKVPRDHDGFRPVRADESTLRPGRDRNAARDPDGTDDPERVARVRVGVRRHFVRERGHPGTGGDDVRQGREGGQVGKDGLRALGGQEFVVARSGTFAVVAVVGGGVAAEDVVGRQEAADADAEGAHELDQADRKSVV